MLSRKIDIFLSDWKIREKRKPLIIKGARQIGKTTSIRSFAQSYKSFIEINFVREPQYKDIFKDGYAVEAVKRQISITNPKFNFIDYNTLILFDELQQQPDCATCLKFFCEDGRYDVICSGSLMGINYNEIESNSVGYKEDYEMHSLDFEEYLWALGYRAEQIEDLYNHMLEVKPLTELEMSVMQRHFCDYMLIGGMPEVVDSYLRTKDMHEPNQIQKQLLIDYEEDITKYAEGLDKAKIKNIYNHIPVFLGKENKKFQITKVAAHARNREYIGTVDWLKDAGVINISYNMGMPELPLKGNYNPSEYKIYFHDIGLLVASLDDESGYDLRANRNFNTYKGAIYENVVASMLVDEGYQLYYYKNEKSTVEMDFFVRDAQHLIPVEVKANDNATASLNRLINDGKYNDIAYGIKLCNKNIGFNGKFYTIPYFLTFLLKRFLREKPAQ